MKKFLFILKAIIWSIFIAVIIINVISLVSFQIIGKEYPVIFGYSYFEVLTGSMYPAIKPGDEVIVKLTKDVKENDIVTFYEDEAIVTHRVVKVDGNMLLTKGDYNNTNDEPIKRSDVIGKVICIIPLLGKIKYIITDWRFLAVLFGAFLICEVTIKKE